MKFIILSVALMFGMPSFGEDVDVPAYKYTIPAPGPCNLPSPSSNGVVYTVCVTGPETHYTCKDKSRVLLESEDGEKHCIDFKLIR